ncbi:MAG TPA: hypothetical protein VMU25_03490 [Candidatus Paceibacterota bacterium]|nr:hypothetical protein [Candidatus Paceibacterota bacterium]
MLAPHDKSDVRIERSDRIPPAPKDAMQIWLWIPAIIITLMIAAVALPVFTGPRYAGMQRIALDTQENAYKLAHPMDAIIVRK